MPGNRSGRDAKSSNFSSSSAHRGGMAQNGRMAPSGLADWFRTYWLDLYQLRPRSALKYPPLPPACHTTRQIGHLRGSEDRPQKPTETVGRMRPRGQFGGSRWPITVARLRGGAVLSSPGHTSSGHRPARLQPRWWCLRQQPLGPGVGPSRPRRLQTGLAPSSLHRLRITAVDLVWGCSEVAVVSLLVRPTRPTFGHREGDVAPAAAGTAPIDPRKPRSRPSKRAAKQCASRPCARRPVPPV